MAIDTRNTLVFTTTPDCDTPTIWAATLADVSVVPHLTGWAVIDLRLRDQEDGPEPAPVFIATGRKSRADAEIVRAIALGQILGRPAAEVLGHEALDRLRVEEARAADQARTRDADRAAWAWRREPAKVPAWTAKEPAWR